MADDDDEDTPTIVMEKLLDEIDSSPKAKRKFMQRWRDNSAAGRDYKALKDYLWSLTKKILSKWYVYLMIALGSGATFRESIESAIRSINN